MAERKREEREKKVGGEKGKNLIPLTLQYNFLLFELVSRELRLHLVKISILHLQCRPIKIQLDDHLLMNIAKQCGIKISWVTPHMPCTDTDNPSRLFVRHLTFTLLDGF